MTEWIISSSVLIVIVIALRALLKGRISLRLQYGLWALVLVRLLIPFSLPGTGLSVMNTVPEQAVSQAEENLRKPIGYIGYDQSALPVRPTPAPGASNSAPEREAQYQQALKDWEAETETIMAQTGTPVTLNRILTAVWAAGAAITGLLFLISNLRFGRKLRASRTAITAEGSVLPTYRSDYVATPCLYGLFRPSVYLTGEVCDSEQLQGHVLAHELTHYRHRDHIWSFLRCVCLAVHWYNPLVWVAAILSRRDAELACDEATIHSLGEEQRTDYGRTLISMTCIKQDARDLLLTATTMNSGKKELKERVRLIARKPRTALVTLVAVILVAVLAVGCTFTAANLNTAAPTETEPTTPTETQPTDPVETGVTVYPQAGGSLVIPIPLGFEELLLVEEIVLQDGDYLSFSSELYRFREKVSVEDWMYDHGEDDPSVGWLYSIEVQTQDEFDYYYYYHLRFDLNRFYFAKDEAKELYYSFVFPTEPVDYRRGGDKRQHSDPAWQEMWQSLLDIRDTALAENIIAANGLVPFVCPPFGDGLPEDAAKVEFSAQNIRTGSWVSDYSITVIRSVEELNSYYEQNKDRFDFRPDPDPAPYHDTIGFPDACEKYDDAYFEDRILILLLWPEGSCCSENEVSGIGLTADGQLCIGLMHILTEGDWATETWHYFIEPAPGVDVQSAEDIMLYYDGKLIQKDPA